MDAGGIAVCFLLAAAMGFVSFSDWSNGRVKVARKVYVERDDQPVLFHLVIGGRALIGLVFLVAGIAAVIA